MDIVKRKRGRPVGDGVDDTPILKAMARILVEAGASGRDISPTSAARRAKAGASPSDLRRLQRKWKRRKSAFLREAAEQRSAPKLPMNADPSSAYKPLAATVALEIAYEETMKSLGATMSGRPHYPKTATEILREEMRGLSSYRQAIDELTHGGIAEALRATRLASYSPATTALAKALSATRLHCMDAVMTRKLY